MQNALCVQCARCTVHAPQSRKSLHGLASGSPRLTLALSTNQVAIPALSCTTVRQYQPMVLSTIIYHPCSRSFLQFLEPIHQCEKRAMAIMESSLFLLRVLPRILDPPFSRDNQLDFFSLDHDK